MAELFPTLDSINSKKEYLMQGEIDRKEYNSFMVNRGLSQFMDTVLFANEMNKYYSLDKDMQYDFYFYSIPKGKRFSKWAKSNTSKDAELVMKAYNINRSRALEYLNLLSEDNIKELEELMNPGGKAK